MPPRPRPRSTPPKLQTSTPLHLHVPAPTAYLPSSRSPYLYTSTSTRLQRISRTLEANSYTSLHLQHTFMSLSGRRISTQQAISNEGSNALYSPSAPNDQLLNRTLIHPLLDTEMLGQFPSPI